MIIDNIENACCYYSLGDNFEKALRFIKENDLTRFDNGKYEICGDDVCILVQDYTSKKPELGVFEIHKKHIDIQYIIKGQERLGYAHSRFFEQNEKYNEQKDVVFGEVSCASIVLAQAGDFVIFMPQEAHMPQICVDRPYYVKKAVIKIKIN